MEDVLAVVDELDEVEIVLEPDVFSSCWSSCVRSVQSRSHNSETTFFALRLLLRLRLRLSPVDGEAPDELPDDVLELDVLDVLAVSSIPVELLSGGVPDELPDGPTGVFSGLDMLNAASSRETGLK